MFSGFALIATMPFESDAQVAARPVRRQPPPTPICQHCGTERWAVKTLSDAGASQVVMEPEDATVAELVAIPAPKQSSLTMRIHPLEKKTLRVHATLEGFKREADQDFHIVISDPNDPSKTMIAEIPDQDCSGACTATQKHDFQATRDLLVSRFGEAKSSFTKIKGTVPIVITGVGFFDFAHGQTGLAFNCVELHPVLSIEFPAAAGAGQGVMAEPIIMEQQTQQAEALLFPTIKHQCIPGVGATGGGGSKKGGGTSKKKGA
jgi:hypothetical protein